MSLARPQHLVDRQITGRAFSEEISVLRTAGAYNDDGEYVETDIPADTLCATAPPSTQDARVRELTEGGVKLEAMRLFWTAEDLRPASSETAGDIVVFPREDGERFRVRMTQRWGDFSESLAVRQEAQDNES